MFQVATFEGERGYYKALDALEAVDDHAESYMAVILHETKGPK